MAEGEKTIRVRNTSAPFGGLYLLTIIGAAVYFIEQADGFWEGVLGLLKAFVWPAFAVYRALELMNL
jgi:hypothetical protein